MSFHSLNGGKGGTAAGLEFKRRLEELERLEFELMQIVAVEIQDSIDMETGRDLSQDMDLLATIRKLKDNAAKTLQIMTSLARYSGLKRGTLPREIGLSNEPKDDLERARRIVEERREAMRAKAVS